MGLNIHKKLIFVENKPHYYEDKKTDLIPQTPENT